MDWLARDGLQADQHERYVQPLYEAMGDMQPGEPIHVQGTVRL